jgi:hypothetical protein
MLTNKYLIAGIAVLVLAVIAVVMFVVVGSDNEPEFPTVILTNEAKTSYTESVVEAYGGPVHLPLPVKAEAALVEGWIDTGSCAPGQGRYFYKTNLQSNEKLDYLLIYNASDVLIGVYFYSKETSLPEPWKTAEELNPFTDSLIDYPHSNVAVYFGASANPCSKDRKTDFTTAKLVNNTASGMITSLELPMIASQATAGKWVDTFLCETGKGRFHYKLKPESDEKLEYLLIYNILDVLIGVYFFSTDTTLTEPWKIAEDLTPNNIILLDYPHSNIVFYFGNPVGSCSRSDASSVGMGGSDHQGGHAVREYEATPTPAPKLNAAETLSKISTSLLSGSKTFKATNAADESSIATGITSSQVAELLSSITDAQEGTSKWIDNISHRSLTGNTVSITAILTSAKSDNLQISLWVNDDNDVNLIEITGTITHDGKEFSKLHISPE